MKFNKGERIFSQGGIERIIVEVLSEGYLWKYPLEDMIYDSRNSNDPQLEWWSKKMKYENSSKQ